MNTSILPSSWTKREMGKAKECRENYGHTQGSKNERICEESLERIKYLTVYAFSTENWNQPESEVSALMKLLRNYIKDLSEDRGEK